MTAISLSNKSPAEQCFENPLILEKIIGYSGPNSMCALARLNKRTNQVYKDINEEKFPKLYEKRIQRVFTHPLSKCKTALALSVEKYLKIMEERKSSGKSIPSLENPFERPVSIAERLLNFLSWSLGYRPEEPDVSKVKFTATCKSLSPPGPEAVLLDHSEILAISPGFINREIAQLYLTCIEEIKSTLSSFIKNGRLFECRALMKSSQLNPDILDDICWKVIQDTRILEKFDECELSGGNDDPLFDEIPGTHLDSLKKVYRYNVTTRTKDSFWRDRLQRDFQREGIQGAWTKELLRQCVSAPEDEDLDAENKAFEEIKEVYRRIWSIEKLETEPEDAQLLEELIKSRSTDIRSFILDRACMTAILNIENNNTRLLEVLIEFYGCDPNVATFVSLEYLLGELIHTGHNRIIDLLRGFNGTNELLNRCSFLITRRDFINIYS